MRTFNLQEAASEWAKSREVERERLASVQQMYAAAAAQAAALSQRSEELERQLHESQMKARNGSGWRRKSEMERRIVRPLCRITHLKHSQTLRSLEHQSWRHQNWMLQSTNAEISNGSSMTEHTS